MRKVNFNVPGWLRRRVDAFAARNELGVSATVRVIVSSSLTAEGLPWWIFTGSKPTFGRSGRDHSMLWCSMDAEMLARLDTCTDALRAARDPMVTLMWGEITRSDVLRLILASALDEDGFIFTERPETPVDAGA